MTSPHSSGGGSPPFASPDSLSSECTSVKTGKKRKSEGNDVRPNKRRETKEEELLVVEDQGLEIEDEIKDELTPKEKSESEFKAFGSDDGSPSDPAETKANKTNFQEAYDVQWLFSTTHFRQTPSRRDGINSTEELIRRSKGIKFIHDCAHDLKLHKIVLATACIYFHRFYMRESLAHFHHYDIAGTCLFLSCKTEESTRRLAHVATICARRAHKKDTWDDPKECEKWNSTIRKREPVVMATLNFDLSVEHPYLFVLALVDSLKITNDMVKIEHIDDFYAKDSAQKEMVEKWLASHSLVQNGPGRSDKSIDDKSHDASKHENGVGCRNIGLNTSNGDADSVKSNESIKDIELIKTEDGEVTPISVRQEDIIQQNSDALVKAGKETATEKNGGDTRNSKNTCKTQSTGIHCDSIKPGHEEGEATPPELNNADDASKGASNQPDGPEYANYKRYFADCDPTSELFRYQTLAYAIDYLKNQEPKDILKTRAWALIDNSLYGPLCLFVKAKTIASAAVFLAAKMLQIGELTPDKSITDKSSWWSILDDNVNKIAQAADMMLSQYSSHPILCKELGLCDNPIACAYDPLHYKCTVIATDVKSEEFWEYADEEGKAIEWNPYDGAPNSFSTFAPT
ncbi:2736_t:CDS:1 [Paraglomus brasilianum]|uniref:2736_t:CDS:1 n=1 Tax=Paraglomus brasilianum TaxID=144538 RepID=A0A9N8WEC8_9GLOM|nr:2736_t:CDS:1 [Paraglomus brasilianum]